MRPPGVVPGTLWYASTVLELLTLLTLALPAQAGPPGWTEIGPERGHVMEAAVGPDRVSVVTRVGVLSADRELTRWSRDPRFPPDCFVIEYGPDGVGWAGAGGRVWRVGDKTESALQLDGGSHAVELAVTGSGAAIVAARGSAAGVYRIPADGSASARVLADVDPWALLTGGDEVWVGTLGQGIWHSEDDGKTFRQVIAEGEYTGLGRVGDEVWAGDRDGNLRSMSGGETVAALSQGWVLDVVPVGSGILLMAELPGGHQGLYTWNGKGAAAPLGEMDVDEDPGRINYTGAWALGDGTCIVGTFRRGPLVYDGKSLVPRRAGFRATVVRGAVQSGDRFTLALMGTGVYTSLDGWGSFVAEHQPPGPVTDTVSLGVHAGSVVAVDFDGVTVSDAVGSWNRFGGVDEPGAGRPNALADVGVDAKGRWWGVTEGRALWLREGEQWTSCAVSGGRRFDGTGETLLLVTDQGYMALKDCAGEGEPAWPGIESLRRPYESRSDGEWLAAAGGLWRRGKQVAPLPERPVDAMAVRGNEVLVVQAGEVLLCKGGACELAARSLPQSLHSVGWLPDGRIWAAEARGTLLATGGTADIQGWSDIHTPPGGNPRPPFELFRVPWSDEGRYTGGPPGAPGQGNPGNGPGPGEPHPGPDPGAPHTGPGPGDPGPGPGPDPTTGDPSGQDPDAEGGTGGRRALTVLVVGAALALLLVVFRKKKK